MCQLITINLKFSLMATLIVESVGFYSIVYEY